MGKNTERYRAYLAQASAAAQQRKAAGGRQSRESSLQEMEGLLGTDAQAQGQLGVSSEALQYAGRYSVDEASLKGLLGHNIGGAAGQGQLRQNVDAANQLLQQAQDAAQGGDASGAANFRQQADEMLFQGIGQYKGLSGSNLEGLVQLSTDPNTAARGALGSPMAQSVGEMVRQGREFLDPNSETSESFKRSLTESGERSIAAERRGAQRQSRDIGLARGSGRNAHAQMAISARTSENFAAQRAQLHSEAGKYFETFSRDFAAKSVQMGQAFLQNQGGIREQFQGAMDMIAMSGIDLAQSSAQMSAGFSAQSQRDEQASKGRTMEMIGVGLGLAASVVGAVFTGGASLALGAGVLAGASGGGGRSAPQNNNFLTAGNY